MLERPLDRDAGIAFFRGKAAEFRRLAKQADNHDLWTIAERLLHAAADLETKACEIERDGLRS